MSRHDDTLDPDTTIAVVGMACRVPGASDPTRFWENLLDGVESIEDLDREELRKGGEDPSLLEHPDYVARGAALSGMAMWDHGFFGMSPKEAAAMDPQHRHFLELSWEALESAGHSAGTFGGRVGVFAGCGANTYMMFNLLADPDLLREQGFFLLRHIGNDKDFLATRVSYHLDLRGPGVNIQTACSTSLAAIHIATQSLLSHECDMALAGGVTITHPHRRGYLHREGEILSPDGHCRAFDVRAGGTVLGDGAGAVVLRRLSDALEDGDTVHAVIRGTAMNNDGSAKVGYLAPSVDGQAEVVAEALAVAGVDPDTVGYVEAHGTGTNLGDPIEVTALTRAFRTGTDRTGYCGLGSVKTNIGHLDTAAGVAGFIKAVLAVEHGEIPPSLHFREPNPELQLETSPFRVVAERTPWDAGDAPRRAGVSSLGVGGTNVHVILQEPPPSRSAPPTTGYQLLPLSGRNRSVVGRAGARLVDHLELNPTVELADVAWTLQAGRAPFDERRVVVASSTDELIEALVTGDPDRVHDHTADGARRDVALLFAGGGSQYPGMALDLHGSIPSFAADVERCLGLLPGPLQEQVRRLLLPGGGGEAEISGPEAERPSLALPALFIVQWAQARLWQRWGVEPAALAGHSMGEYTAAVLAGVMDVEEALDLVVLRGRLFEEVTGGGMLSVSLPEAELRDRLSPELSVAAVNGPELCVASGPREAVAALAHRLEAEGVETRRIRIDVAAHSRMLDPILDAFRDRLQRAKLHPPSLPLASNLSGTWLTDREATDPEYWVRQLRETVRFSDGLRELLATPDRVLLEVGPGRTLATLARIHPDRDGAQETFTSLRHPDDQVNDQAFMLRVLGELWQRGVEVDWSALHGEPRRRIPLPTYPFEHERHLVETGPLPSTHAMALVTERDTAPGAKAREGAPALGETPGEGPETAPHQWLHRVRWADVAGAAPCSPAGASDSTPPGRTLLVVPRGRGEGPAFRRLQEELEGEVTVHSGPPSTREAWLQLLDAREPSGGNDGDGFVRQVLHAGYMERGSAEEGGVSDLIALGQALLELDPGERPELVVLTCRAHALEEAEGDAVEGAVAEKHLEGGDPAGALLAGPVRVLPAEVPGLRVRWVDLGAPDEPLPAHLLRSRDMPAVMAVRDGKILTPTFEAVPPEYGPGSPRTPEAGDAAGRRPSAQLPESPVVLITGGTGGVGLEVARHLVRTRNARVALLARTPLPEEFAEGEGTDPRQLRARRIVDELRAEGGQVRVLVADVADRDALVRAREEIREAFGEVDLLVHAAGRLDDGRIGDRERSRTEAVLRPKVAGTRALMEVFRDPAPARVVLFSSISAEAGLPGQVDYAAANAFLDAVAEHGSAGSGGCSGKGEGSGNDSSTADGTASSGPGWGASGTRLRSVGWSAWSETGMAADRARGLVHWPPHGADGDGDWHEARDPRFDVVEPASGRVRVRLREGRSWVLDEHQTRDGLPLVPGAGFVSLLHGAARELGREGDALRLEELYFLAPFVVPGGETREMELRLPTDGPGPVAVVGRSDPGEPWTEHVQGRIAAPPEDSGDGEPLSTPEDVPEWEGTGGALRQDLQLGPRWDNAARIRHAPGSQEVFLELELPEAVRGDVGHDPLHPGLLDNGTALAGPLLPGFGQEGHVHVPASFGTLEVLRPLPSRVLSRIRLSPEQDGESEDLAVLDVDLVDDRGQICVRARQFMMVRVPAQEMERLGEEAREGAEHRRMALSAALEDGLPTEVGLAILDRVLDDGSLPARVLVSPGPVEERIRDLRAAAGAGAGGAGPEAEGPDVDVAPVEAALLELEAVREAAVTAHEDRPGDVRLVAHVVMDPEVFQTVSEMRRSLARVLPREMVPRNFVELEALPRAADGSVARRRLEDPFAPQDDHVGPATPMQEVVARIWQELLGAERIGIHDNFLDVGGHSLLAMRAILRLEKETGVRLGPVEINMYTLEQIAAHLEAQGGAAPRGAGEVEGEGRGETPVEGQAGNGDEGSGGDGFLSRVRRLIPGGGS